MISFQVVQLEVLAQQGKNFNWKRPVCRCGNEKPWKHGFVSRYFDGFLEAVWCRKYRCNLCSCVITTRPKSHFERIQTSIASVVMALQHRLTSGCWPRTASRQRALPWLEATMEQARFEGLNPEKLLKKIETTHHPNLIILGSTKTPPLTVVAAPGRPG